MHRYFVLSTIPEEKNRFEQKGIKEELLCSNCEQLFSSFEHYVSQVFYRGASIKFKRENNFIIIENLNYDIFKLFELSILWRVSASKYEFYNNVKLNIHEEKIRKMIINKNHGFAHEYGCTIWLLMQDDSNPIEDLILQPDFIRVDGQRCFRFVFGGALWLFVVSNHPQRFIFKDLFLNEQGKIVIPLKNAWDTELIKKFGLDIKKAKKLNGIL